MELECPFRPLIEPTKTGKEIFDRLQQRQRGSFYERQVQTYKQKIRDIEQ